MASLSASKSGNRSYSDAIECLNSLQSNAAVVEAIRNQGGKDGPTAAAEGVRNLSRIGYKPSDLDRLNVVHITGTKGKGSTCAFVSSLLRTIAPSARVGLYTSPHLVAVRERIRINGKPIGEDMFAKYFFEVWEKLEATAELVNPGQAVKPMYFSYLTLMCYHVFLQEKMDATILEVGIGGTFDDTNAVPRPIVTGVSSLGLDHVYILGHTIPEIAHHKGGIYKAGVPALAIDGPSEGLDALERRAQELKASSFTRVPVIPALSSLSLGLAGAHQRLNATLAIAVVQTFLASPRLPPAFSSHSVPLAQLPPSSADHLPSLSPSLISPSPLPKEMVHALENTICPGRCQKIKDSGAEMNPNLTWFLDGAHTSESVAFSGDWFCNEILEGKRQQATRVLVFNCTSWRSGPALLGSLLEALSPFSRYPFDHVVFCTNASFSDGSFSGELVSKCTDPDSLVDLTVQRELASTWSTLTSSLPSESGKKPAEVHILKSIQDAIRFARGVAKEGQVDVLVTGSLLLVGGLFSVAGLPLDT